MSPHSGSRVLGCFSQAIGVSAHAFEALGEGATVGHVDAPFGWGLGRVEGGHGLVRHTPRAPAGGEISLAEVTRRMPTRAVIAHSHHGPDRPLTIAHAQPVRLGPWLGAVAGDLPASDEALDALVGSLPDPIRRNLSGRSAAPLFCHLVLAELEAGGHPHRSWQVPPSAVVEAIARARTRWRREIGEPTLVALMTHGEGMFALVDGAPLTLVRGATVGPRVRLLPPESGQPGQVTLWCGAEASEAPGQALPDGHIAAVDRAMELTLTAL